MRRLIKSVQDVLDGLVFVLVMICFGIAMVTVTLGFITMIGL